MPRNPWNIVMSARNLFSTPLAEKVSTKPTKLAVEFLEPRAMLSRDSGFRVRLSDYAPNCDTVYVCPTGPVCDTSGYTRDCPAPNGASSNGTASNGTASNGTVPNCPPTDCEYDSTVPCTPTSTPTPCPSPGTYPEPCAETPNCESKPRDCEKTSQNGNCEKERGTDCQPKNCDTQPKCNGTPTPTPCPGSEGWKKAVNECKTYGAATVKCETKTPVCDTNGAKKNGGNGNSCEVERPSSNNSNKQSRYEKSNEDRCDRPNGASKSNSNCDTVKVSTRAVDQCFGDSRAVSKIVAARFR